MEEAVNTIVGSRAPWLRAITIGALAQVLLFAGYLGLAAQGLSESALFAVVVAASLLLYLGAGYLAARTARQSHVLLGVVAALAGVAVYFAYVTYLVSTGAMNATGTRPVEFAEALSLANLADHGLKVIAAAVGAFAAGRKATA
jgi:hypothetical protein